MMCDFLYQMQSCTESLIVSDRIKGMWGISKQRMIARDWHGEWPYEKFGRSLNKMDK